MPHSLFQTSSSSLKRVLALFVVCLLALPALAQAGEAGKGGGINFVTLAMELFGGLALFLYGMEKMGTSLKLVAGDRMKGILHTLTTNRFMGMITGAFVTAIIQSSSVTTVLLVGFVTAELMTLAQAIGVIFGANIGTTITAQVIAFKVTKYALVMIIGGFLMITMGKKESMRQYGHLLLGLGLVFFGMNMMSGAMHPLRQHPPFMELMQTVSNPMVGVMVGAMFTALVQSSSATTGVVLALAMQGLISLEAGIALTLGANIGTCVTAGLASLGKPREAVRVAVAHTLFNVLGALLIVAFIPPFAEVVRNYSPSHPELEGLSRLAAEVPRQVANAHTLFNLVMAVLFLPFTGVIARFCLWVVPEQKKGVQGEGVEGIPARYRPRYLDDTMLSTPAFALSLVRREMNVMAELVEGMVADVLPSLFERDLKRIESIRQRSAHVDEIYEYFTRHLSKMGSRNLPPKVSDEVLASVAAIIEIKYISDIVNNNVHVLAEYIIKEKAEIADEGKKDLQRLQESVVWAFRSASTAFITDNQESARMVFDMKEEIVGIDMELRSRQIRSLHATVSENLAAYTAFMEILDVFKRIFYHAKRIAKIETKEESVAIWSLSGDAITRITDGAGGVASNSADGKASET
ncbi:MAG: Na/Pi cotransporter family protein [Magnetococcales bacterium]|nr:Na/Pi cotransporter family protein [Magnetococcales bacterium]